MEKEIYLVGGIILNADIKEGNLLTDVIDCLIDELASYTDYNHVAQTLLDEGIDISRYDLE